MQIQPTQDRVVIRPSATKEVTDGGLIIPDVAQERPHEGTIIAIGPGRYDSGVFIPTTLTIGDTVIYGKYSGIDTSAGGEELVIIRESDIVAVVKE